MELSPRKKKIFKRLLFATAVLAALYLAVVVAIRLLLPKDRIRQTIEQELSKALDRDVAVADISVGFYPDLELVGNGIRVASLGAEVELASARRVRIDMDLSKLLRRQYEVENIVVGSPHIGLVRDRDGQWNVQDLVNKARRDEAAPPAKPGKRNGKVEVGPIRINNGAIRIHDRASGRTLAVTEIKAFLDLKKEEFRLKSANISYEPLEGKVTATVTRFSEPGPMLEIESRILVLKQGPFADVAPELDAGDEIADIVAKASGPLNALKVQTDFSVNRKATDGVQTTGMLRGTLNAREGVLEVSALEPHYGESTLSLSGVGSNLWKDERTVTLEGAGKLALEQMLSLAGEDLVSRLQPKGVANAKLSLTASMQAVELTANFDLLNASMVIPNVMTKPVGVPAGLLVDGRYTIPDEIVIDNFQLDIAAAHLDGAAKVLPGQEPWLRTSVTAEDIPLDCFDRLPEISFEEGKLSFNAEIWQSNPSEKQVNHSGEATIGDAVLTTPHLKESFKDLNADVAWKNKEATIKTASFQFAGSSLQTQGQISDFATPKIVGAVQADTLDLDRIISAIGGPETEAPEAKPEKPQTSEPSAEDVDTFSLKLAVEAQSVYAGKIKADSLNTIWEATEETHSFEPLEMNIFDGTLTGSVWVYTDTEPIRWQTGLVGQNIEMGNILSQLETKQTRAKGRVNVEANLDGLVADNADDVFRSLQGQLTITAKDGEIRQYSLLKNIFLLMHVPVGPALIPGVREVTALNTVLEVAKTRGRSLNPAITTFNKIHGEFQITDGVARTENIRLESGMADLIGKGDIDLPNQQLDMVVTATPMGAISSLLGIVPFAGGALKGAKEAIISTKFLAKGPIADPEVKVAAVEKLKRIGGGKENPER